MYFSPYATDHLLSHSGIIKCLEKLLSINSYIQEHQTLDLKQETT